MNKVVSSEIKYFHKEKTMNAEKWEKAEKVHSILLYPSVLQRKVKNGTRKTTIIGIVVMALYLITMLLMPRFKHYNMS